MSGDRSKSDHQNLSQTKPCEPLRQRTGSLGKRSRLVRIPSKMISMNTEARLTAGAINI